MKPTPQQLLPIYRRALARYEAEDRQDRIPVQRALIKRLEKEARIAEEKQRRR